MRVDSAFGDCVKVVWGQGTAFARGIFNWYEWCSAAWFQTLPFIREEMDSLSLWLCAYESVVPHRITVNRVLSDL